MTEETSPGTGDVVRRFIVENRPVRGHWVRLDTAWRELCAICAFLPLACASVRMVAWWLLLLAPVVAALG